MFHQAGLSGIMCFMYVAHNLGCGNLTLPPEIDSFDEGVHPSAAGPHKSCLTRQQHEETVPQVRASASVGGKGMKDCTIFDAGK